MLRLVGADLRAGPRRPLQGSEQLRETLRPVGRGAGADRAERRDLGQPVRQCGEPPGPLPHHRPGDLGPDRRRHRRLHLRRRHRRHVGRRRHVPEGAQPRRCGSCWPTRWERHCTTGTSTASSRPKARRSAKASARAGSRPISKAPRSTTPIRSPMPRPCPTSSTSSSTRVWSWAARPAINIAGAVRVARRLGPGHTIVTILCDYGTRYQSKLFNPAFLREKGLPVPAWLA